jgi:hypothetical protein
VTEVVGPGGADLLDELWDVEPHCLNHQNFLPV